MDISIFDRNIRGPNLSDLSAYEHEELVVGLFLWLETKAKAKTDDELGDGWEKVLYTGVVMASVGPPLLDKAVFDWSVKAESKNATTLAAWFLDGYWDRKTASVSEAVVDRMLALLDGGNTAWDSPASVFSFGPLLRLIDSQSLSEDKRRRVGEALANHMLAMLDEETWARVGRASLFAPLHQVSCSQALSEDKRQRVREVLLRNLEAYWREPVVAYMEPQREHWEKIIAKLKNGETPLY